MILHAWWEPGHRMRVRLTSTDSIQTGNRETSYASSSAEVQRLVQQWLDSLADKQDQSTPPVTPS
jgi:hypothetical protein